MSEKNDNFDNLKRLLKLKRHEIPPPGYFNNFSGNVLARIRAGEEGQPETLFEKLQSDGVFWHNLLRLLRVRPGIIGAAATCLCLLFLVGVVLLDDSETGPLPPVTVADQPSTATPEASPILALDAPQGGLTISTNPISSLQPISTPFDSPQNPLVQPVGFVPAGQ